MSKFFAHPPAATKNPLTSGVFAMASATEAKAASVEADGSGAEAKARRANGGKIVLAAIALAAFGTASLAQWTVTVLHPSGSELSRMHGIGDGQQVGNVRMNLVRHASLWSGSAASWVILDQSGGNTDAYAVSQGRQVGVASGYALMWIGTPNSVVYLNPSGATGSTAVAIDGNIQGGTATIDGVVVAGIWRGTAASWVNLNPPTASASGINAVRGQQQAGYALINGAYHAGIWAGTAASWIDLNPVQASESIAKGCDGGKQVGFARINGVTHACVWNSTAASWIDLHPAGALNSSASATAHGRHVGSALVGGRSHASLWTGSAQSWVDLNEFLPPGFSGSSAEGISIEGNYTLITGNATDSATGLMKAILWTRENPPECAADFNEDSIADLFDYLDFVAALSVRSTYADFNNDGVIDFFDYLEFVQVFSEGC